MNISKRIAAIVGGLVLSITGIVGGLAATSNAAVTATVPAGTIQACVYPGSNRTMERVYWADTTLITCPAGTYYGSWSQTGPKGDTGAPGAPGAPGVNGTNGTNGTDGTDGTDGTNGAPGASGVVSTSNTTLVNSPTSVATGGSFVTNSTLAGTVTLPAGTYLISVNAKATPSSDTGAVEIFPQFFVYNQVANSGFNGDLFNIGAGALESGTHDTIDSYYSGSTQIVLSASTTLRIYAFGYDSDTSAGAYNLDSLTFTATSLATS